MTCNTNPVRPHEKRPLSLRPMGFDLLRFCHQRQIFLTNESSWPHLCWPNQLRSTCGVGNVPTLGHAAKRVCHD